MSQRICSIDGCGKFVHGHGWCDTHYRRWARNGDPLISLNPIGVPAVERFWDKVNKTEECWLWTKPDKVTGYGYFRADNKTVTAHRFSYELLVGPIPEGLVLDHVRSRGCISKACVNPAHLEPVTQQENLRRSNEERHKGEEMANE
jgi:hypothetical protein